MTGLLPFFTVINHQLSGWWAGVRKARQVRWEAFSVAATRPFLEVHNL
ncbi:MAG: hypothetical protein ACJA1I_000203 [Zhongshania marina]|jgi:hypothetical protein